MSDQSNRARVTKMTGEGATAQVRNVFAPGAVHGEQAGGTSVIDPATAPFVEPLRHLAAPISSAHAIEIREDLRSKLFHSLKAAEVDINPSATRTDAEAAYRYGLAIGDSQALAAITNPDATDLDLDGGVIRDAFSKTLELNSPGRSDVIARPLTGADSDRFARELFRNAAFTARMCEWHSAGAQSSPQAQMLHGKFNALIFNATTLVEGTPHTSLDGHTRASKVLREWARDPERKDADLDDPRVLDELYTEAYDFEVDYTFEDEGFFDHGS